MEKQKKEGVGSLFFLIVLAVIITDQAAKFLITRLLQASASYTVIPRILKFTFIYNTGAGFGIFQGRNSIFIFVSLAIIGIILFFIDRIVKKKWLAIPFSLILGGAIGNLIDRIVRGYVVDFIDFSIWPAFNIADSAISIGAVILIFYTWKD